MRKPYVMACMQGIYSLVACIGCARGFLSATDTAWLIRGAGQGGNVLNLLCEREIVFLRTCMQNT